ncbi:MAG: hypothetical protein AB7N76_09320 [Planctomycetota bacterium]
MSRLELVEQLELAAPLHGARLVLGPTGLERCDQRGAGLDWRCPRSGDLRRALRVPPDLELDDLTLGQPVAFEGGPVADLLGSPDGRWALVGYESARVALWPAPEAGEHDACALQRAVLAAVAGDDQDALDAARAALESRRWMLGQLDGAGASALAFAPGCLFAAAGSERSDVLVVDLEAGVTHTLDFSALPTVDRLALSPDGQRVAAESDEAPGEVLLLGPGDQDPRPLPALPQFSLDGNWAALRVDGRTEVHAAALEGALREVQGEACFVGAWLVRRGEDALELIDPATGEVLDRVEVAATSLVPLGEDLVALVGEAGLRRYRVA